MLTCRDSRTTDQPTNQPTNLQAFIHNLSPDTAVHPEQAAMFAKITAHLESVRTHTRHAACCMPAILCCTGAPSVSAHSSAVWRLSYTVIILHGCAPHPLAVYLTIATFSSPLPRPLGIFSGWAEPESSLVSIASAETVSVYSVYICTTALPLYVWMCLCNLSANNAVGSVWSTHGLQSSSGRARSP